MRVVPRWAGLAVLTAALVLAGCSAKPGAGEPVATATGTADGSVSPSDSATPSDSASPGDSASPSDSASPGSATPTDTAGPSASSSASGTPTVALQACDSVVLTRVSRVDLQPRRTIEVATVVSDGRNLTPGTREQTDFTTPVLTSPAGTAVTDAVSMDKVAGLVQRQRHTVLLDRPAAPDADASASRKPFSAPGTYVVYNASSRLVADVVLQCSGQEQTWNFDAEADLTTGSVNCAVEPAKGNALAGVVYQQYC